MNIPIKSKLNHKLLPLETITVRQGDIPIGNIGLNPVQHILGCLVHLQEYTIENLQERNTNIREKNNNQKYQQTINLKLLHRGDSTIRNGTHQWLAK